jgi:Zn-dependent M28 family amino/carboxypeptidase
MQKNNLTNKGNKSIPILALFLITAISLLLYLLSPRNKRFSGEFDGDRAYGHVVYQVGLGPRIIGSKAHADTIDWIQDELTNNGWDVTIQEGNRLGVRVQNVIAERGEGDDWIIIGAHFDSRSVADQDPDPAKRSEPVPGANDGASGVAVLLELSRALSSRLDKKVWLVFFDAEDNGNIQGQDWILGSREFVDQLEGKPDAVVIIDMIGDADLDLYWEKNSDQNLTTEIWDVAKELGYSDVFIPQYKYTIIDDHIPFVRAGIVAVDIIDFDYPYWHTTEDTPDKVSPQSLDAVGSTILRWLEITDFSEK